MCLEYYELRMRQAGNIAAAEYTRVTREQYGDIPLPSNNGQTAAVVEIVRFSDEARKGLEIRGFKIYPLTGQSISSLRGQGRKFWSTWHENYPDFETLTSRLSEVAINPDPEKFYLPESNKKTLEAQQAMVRKFSEQFSRGRNRISGVAAILGKAPDYVEVAFTHLDKTGERLFGEKYKRERYWTYTSTATRVGSFVAIVGDFEADDELYVDRLGPGGGGGVWVAPLVVPA